MKFSSRRLSGPLFAVIIHTVTIATLHAEPRSPAVPGRYIVVLKHGHSPGAVAREHGINPRVSYSHALNGFAGTISEGRLRALSRDPRVEFLEPDLQLVTTAQTLPTGVRRIGADVSGVAKIDGLDERANVDIAILDTGIAPHTDLNRYTNVSFIYGQSTDGNGHGTHMAGIAAALDNGIGVVGVAPGARLWGVKVVDDSGLSTTSWAIQGIDFVTRNAAQIEVANLSLTGIGYSYALRQAIINSVSQGVVFVVSAGNDSRDVYGPDGLPDTADDSIPAAYPEVMTVSALSDTDGVAGGEDVLAGFSNFSRSVAAGNPVNSPGAAIDLAAPGVNILSTDVGGGYATASGTSASAPHAVGATALYIARYGRATNAAGVAAIRQALINSAQPQNTWGSVSAMDPDVNNEGLVNVRGINPSLDSPPAVVITAPGTGSSFNTGSAVQFTGVATDSQDGDRTANLVWTSNIDGPIGTGGNFSRTLSDGTHTITAIATDSGGKTGSDSIIITILAPPPPALSVTVTTDKSTYANRNKVFITATVTDGVNRVAGAAAHLEIVKANGSRISSDATSDSYGVARFQYKVNTVRDGLGIHTATVSCSHNGYISGSGSATYQVR